MVLHMGGMVLHMGGMIPGNFAISTGHFVSLVKASLIGSEMKPRILPNSGCQNLWTVSQTYPQSCYLDIHPWKAPVIRWLAHLNCVELLSPKVLGELHHS